MLPTCRTATNHESEFRSNSYIIEWAARQAAIGVNLRRPSAVRMSIKWKNFFGNICWYDLSDNPPKDPFAEIKKSFLWIRLVYIQGIFSMKSNRVGFLDFPHKISQKHLKNDFWRFGMAWFGFVLHQLQFWVSSCIAETKKNFQMYKIKKLKSPFFINLRGFFKVTFWAFKPKFFPSDMLGLN